MLAEIVCESSDNYAVLEYYSDTSLSIEHGLSCKQVNIAHGLSVNVNKTSLAYVAGDSLACAGCQFTSASK